MEEAAHAEQLVRLLSRHQGELFRYIFALLPNAEDARDVLQADGGAVLVREDDRPVAIGADELIVGGDHVVLARAVDVALGLVDVRRVQPGAARARAQATGAGTGAGE